MSTQDIIFIINPKAGGKKVEIEEIVKYENRNFEKNIVFEYTEAKEHAKQLTQSYLAKGYTHFVAVGGDGTVNEVASQIINTSAKLTIIPVGSGNGLARAIGLPLKLKSAIQKVFRHAEKKLDSGSINEIPFFCTSGVGFDAFCAEKFDKKDHNRGLWNYIKVVITSIFSYKYLDAKFNNQPKNAFSVTFGNANQFGNDAFITPDAIMDDNLLDCTIINRHPKPYSLVLGFLLMTKNIRKSNFVEYYRGSSFEISTTENLLIHIDGESMKLESNKAIFRSSPLSLIVTI